MQALTDYIGGLILAGGDHDGEAFTVLPWERRFLAGAFAVTGDAGLSIARGNGKSALVAAIACGGCGPCGPLTGRRREVVVVASAFGQARIVYEDVVAMLGARYDLSDRARWRRQDSQKRGDPGSTGPAGRASVASAPIRPERTASGPP